MHTACLQQMAKFSCVQQGRGRGEGEKYLRTVAENANSTRAQGKYGSRTDYASPHVLYNYYLIVA